jgi:hypothetical protein
MLQKADYLEQVIRARIARRSQHPHQALGRDARRCGEVGEADGRVNVIAEDSFPGSYVAGEHRFDSFAKKLLSEFRIALDPSANGLLEIASQRHRCVLLLPSFVILPAGQSCIDVALLALLRAATQQDDKLLAVFAEINPVARAEIELVFENSRADTLDVREISCGDPNQRGRYLRRGMSIQAIEPRRVWTAT